MTNLDAATLAQGQVIAHRALSLISDRNSLAWVSYYQKLQNPFFDLYQLSINRGFEETLARFLISLYESET